MEETKNVNTMDTVDTISPDQDESALSDADIAFNDISVSEEEICSEVIVKNDEILNNVNPVEASIALEDDKEKVVEKEDSKKIIALESTKVSDSSDITRSNVTSDDSDCTELPPIVLPEPTSGFVNNISVFCISQQGKSHIDKEVPCQDRSEFRWVNNQILISAIADGVGSCQLSDYGAETAVESSLDYLEQYFVAAMKEPDFVFDITEKMKNALSGAMQYAYDSVEKQAEDFNVLSYSMQSTLTLAAYDGTTLYFAHAGDDGIVALNKDGVYAMVTSRIKGEEASSVYPLQSKQWSYGKVIDTVAFVMATDGVLDAFVRPVSENNRVYYRFVEPVFYTNQTNQESANANCQDWDVYLKSDGYRNVVTDDITFVGVVNQEAIKKSQKPVFDDEEWNKQTEEYEKKRRAALYPTKITKTSQDKEKVNISKGYGNAVSNVGAYSSNSGSSNSQKIGGAQNPYMGNKNDHPYMDSYTKSQAPDTSKQKIDCFENVDLFFDGTKQVFSGGIKIGVATVSMIKEVGEELLEHGAAKMKQSRMNRNQQKLNTDSVNKNLSTDTNQ